MRTRSIQFWLAAGLLTLSSALILLVQGSGSWELHVVMEVMATVLALVLALFTLVYFYSRRTRRLLWIGAGFLGTACLDGYHAVASSALFEWHPTIMPEFVANSWLASRLFLSTFLLVSSFTLRKDRRASADRLSVLGIFSAVLLLTAGTILFFSTMAIPPAHYPTWVVKRPAELIAGVIFLAAFFSYWREGSWSRDPFYLGLTYCLLCGALGQIFFMSFSQQLYDSFFNVAHGLKLVSYAMVTVGCAGSIAFVQDQLKRHANELEEVNLRLSSEVEERKRAQRHLKLYQDIFQEMGLGVTVLKLEDPQDLKSFRFVAVNPAAEEAAGLPLASMLGQRLIDCFPSVSESEFPGVYRQVILGQEPHDFGEVYYQGDGVDGFFAIKAFPLPDSCVGVVFENVTERKQAQRALEEREAQLSQASHLAQLGHWDWDLKADQISLSDEMARILGIEVRQISLQRFQSLIHSEEQDHFRQHFDRAFQAAEQFTVYCRMVRPDGSERIVHFIGNWRRSPDGKLAQLWGTGQDVTEKRRAEEALRASELKFRSVTQSVNDAIVSIDSGGLVTFWNPGAQKVFGYSEEEIVGQPVTLLMPPEFVDPHLGGLERLRQGGQPRLMGKTLQLRARHRSGREFPIELSLARWVDEDGSHQYTAMIRDVTERVRAQEELLAFSRRLEQSNRELEDFAYIASHDLQEPLRKISAFSDRLRSRYQERLPREASGYLERIERAAGRLRRLIEDLLTLSRITTRGQPFQVIDLDRVLSEVLSDLELLIEQKQASIQSDPLPKLQADASQMRQLFQNLLSNSLKFVKAGRPAKVKIKCLEFSGEGPEKLVEMRFTDNGIGFDGEYLERIFQPFQRLHGRHDFEGTGMGLAICRKIVERHHGTITATSRPGEGSTFVVKLPARQPLGEGDEAGLTPA